MVNTLPEAKERAWQPNMIVPANHIADVVRSYKILFSLARPKGSIKILGFASPVRVSLMRKRLNEVRNHFMAAKISCTESVVEGSDFLSGMITSMQAMRATFFRPNSVFLSLTDDTASDITIQTLLKSIIELDYGAYLYIPYRKVGLGLENKINLWVKSEDIKDIDEKRPKYFNLSILTAYLLRKNWDATLRFHILLREDHTEEDLRDDVDRLFNLVRMPKNVQKKYWIGGIESIVQSGERGDLNITYLKPNKMDIPRLRQISDKMESSFLYTVDSKVENAFA